MKHIIKNLIKKHIIIAAVLIITIPATVFGIIINSALHQDTGKIPPDSYYGQEDGEINSSTNSLKAICREIFLHMVCSDGITLNYTLSSPENYGIKEYTHGLGDYSFESMQNDHAYYENKLNMLNSINREELNDDDKITYDTLIETLTSFLDMAPYILYQEPLGTVKGIHASLPVLLSEYHFYNEKCIGDYFDLIKSVPDYFRQVIDFEKLKKENGLFMCSAEAAEVIKQCSDFIADPDNNLLIQVFPDNISKLSLDEKTADRYINTNNELIKNTLIPAYTYLADSMKSLSCQYDPAAPGNADTSSNSVASYDTAVSANPAGTGSDLTTSKTGNSGAISDLPDGKKYYTKLLHSETNSEMTPDEMFSLLDETLKDCCSDIAEIILENPHAFDNVYKQKFPSKKPEDIITYLKNAISEEYPELPHNAGELNIKYVHPSLEDTLSPAMYITPPVDRETSDDIYINNSCLDASALFTTLAHESYPGHLYQHEYYMQTDPDPIRLILNFGGYSEGWATYTELYSYKLAGLEDDTARILRDNKLATLCLYSMSDLGLHYYGWSYDKCSDFLSANGIDDDASIKEVYNSVLFEPALYPKYTIGCLEFLNLEKECRRKLGDSYNAVEFHREILRTGPTWFKLLL